MNLVVLLVAMLTPAIATAKSEPVTTHGFPNARLIAAAKAAPAKLLDGGEVYCDADTPVAAWLKRLTATGARQVDWGAGRCELVNDLNPLDAGGSYCVQATITLKHPKNRRDRPEIEIYLEDPKGSKPGAVYAFRAMFDGADGPDYMRFRRDFDNAWRERFKETPAPPCTDE